MKTIGLLGGMSWESAAMLNSVDFHEIEQCQTTAAPPYTRYYKMLEQYHQAQLLFTAIRLDIFSHLNQWGKPSEVAEQTGYDENAVKYILLALTALELIDQNGEVFRNTAVSAEFLSKDSPHYLGETLLFREEMTSLANISGLIAGTEKKQVSYDFARLAEVTVPEMYVTGRVDAFLAEMDKLFPDKSCDAHILDLGGGSGILALEFVRHFPHSLAIVFEHPDVAPVSKRILREQSAPERVTVMEGDFNQDAIGGPYDLIIASGILDFAAKELPAFMMKISDSLKESGYLLLVGQLSDEQSSPSPRMVSWLSGYLNGLPLPPSTEKVNQALRSAGLMKQRKVSAGRFEGQLYRKGEGNG